MTHGHGPVAARFYGNPSVCREQEAAEGSREILPVIVLVKFEKGHGIRGRPTRKQQQGRRKAIRCRPMGRRFITNPQMAKGFRGK